MEVLFSDSFVTALRKHSSIKSIVKKKVDAIMERPIALGEPLKGNFRGYYSCPVKRSFLIIYLYCEVCRKKGDDKVVLCGDCSECADKTIKFVALGPHDETYRKRDIRR